MGMMFATIGTGGCLVTTDPEFYEGQQSPPYLIAHTASPDVRGFVPIDDSTQEYTFSINVMSEDRGERVQARGYFDYGTGDETQPFAYKHASEAELAPSSLDDTLPRTISMSFKPNRYVLPEGCHTFTILAAHAFDGVCPERIADSTSITWFLRWCPQGCVATTTSLADCALPDVGLLCRDAGSQP